MSAIALNRGMKKQTLQKNKKQIFKKSVSKNKSQSFGRILIKPKKKSISIFDILLIFSPGILGFLGGALIVGSLFISVWVVVYPIYLLYIIYNKFGILCCLFVTIILLTIIYKLIWIIVLLLDKRKKTKRDENYW